MISEKSKEESRLSSESEFEEAENSARSIVDKTPSATDFFQNLIHIKMKGDKKKLSKQVTNSLFEVDSNDSSHVGKRRGSFKIDLPVGGIKMNT